MVLDLLVQGSLRFAQLEQQVQGISRKMLTQTLRNCERDGLVHREMIGEKMPVRIDYSLTQLGLSLIPIIQNAKTWAQDNLKCVESARADYDARDHDIRIPI